jgi:hypothetical protein
MKTLILLILFAGTVDADNTKEKIKVKKENLKVCEQNDKPKKCEKETTEKTKPVILHIKEVLR